MIFTVELGEGSPESNSYVDLEYADQYISFYYPDETDWSGKSIGEKELCLIVSTAFIDRQLRWNGRIYKTEQALAWPRTEFKDAEGRTIEAGTIPMLLKDAVVMLALTSLSSDIDEEGVLITSQKYGSSSETYAGPVRDGGNRVVLKLLRDFKRSGFAHSASNMITLQRA